MQDNDEPTGRLPKQGKQTLDRLLEYTEAAEFHLGDSRSKLKENNLYANGAIADAQTQLARMREYIRVDLEQLLRRQEHHLRMRDRRIAELEAELTRLRGAPIHGVPRERTGTDE